MRTNAAIGVLRSENDITAHPYTDTIAIDDQLNVWRASKQITDVKPLLKVINQDNSFYLEAMNTQEPLNAAQEMFLVVRSLKHGQDKVDYHIQSKDILKIGRVKFAVKEIGYEAKSNTFKQSQGHVANLSIAPTEGDDFDEFEEVEAITHQDEDDDIKCRFCWNQDATDQNPLFKACLCQGSVAYIHLVCLKNWLEQKRQSKVLECFHSFFWKAFECEICKKALPLHVKIKGVLHDLVNYQKPQGNFIVLQSLEQEKNTSRIIHVIKPTPAKDIFKLGRGHESDLRINDISVSRLHSKIKFENGSFLLEDNTSKFGTLVLIKQRTPLMPGFNKAIQIGRTVLNFSVKLNQFGKPLTANPRPLTAPCEYSETKNSLDQAPSNFNNSDIKDLSPPQTHPASLFDGPAEVNSEMVEEDHDPNNNHI